MPRRSLKSTDLKYLCGLMVVAALASGCEHSAPLVPQESLIQPYSYELDQKEPFRAPFLAHFRKGDTNLFFIASKHANDVSSPTFRLIERAFADFRFRSVIVEGLPLSRGVNDEAFVRVSQRTCNTTFCEDGEPAYAAVLAKRYGRDIWGAEPDERDVAKEVMAQGYSAADVLGFYFVRLIPSLKRAKEFDKRKPEEIFDASIKAKAASAGLSKEAANFTFQQFKSWYERTNGRALDLSHFDSEQAAPLPQGKLTTQRIAALVGRFRDRAMIKLIAERLNEDKSVLVILGSGHLTSQRLALEKMLGQPVDQYQ